MSDSDRLIPEDHLVANAVQGDAAAFGELYDRYLERIYNFILHQVGRVEDAEDLTEMVFLSAFEHLPRFRRGRRLENFQAWLYRIARNQVIDFYRTRKTAQPIEDISLRYDGPPPASVVQSREEALELVAVVQKLELRYREVVLLRFFQGLSHAETAEILEISENHVRVLQHRALKKIAERLNSRDKHGLQALSPARPADHFRQNTRIRIENRVKKPVVRETANASASQPWLRPLLRSWAAAFLLLFILVGGRIIGFVSDEALPGDPLYSLKMAVENTRLSLADEDAEVDLRLELADRRLAEILYLTAEARYEDLPVAAQGYEQQMAAVSRRVASIEQTNPRKAADLSFAVQTQVEVLSDLLVVLPDPSRFLIEQAIEPPESNGGGDHDHAPAGFRLDPGPISWWGKPQV
jgi:RNA polymerase sigma-70 factor (ECF subfamily)